MTPYPSIAEIQTATSEQLENWVARLPAPSTDIERAAVRRIHLRLQASFAQVPCSRPMDPLAALKSVLGLIGQGGAVDGRFKLH
jgi:hypothetical protein